VAAGVLTAAHSDARGSTSNPTARVAVSGGLIVGLASGAAGYGGASTQPELKKLMSTDAHWFRDQFWWNKIEPRPGHFTFSYYDHYMLQIARLHLHVVPELVGSPRWAARSLMSLPTDPNAFGQFVAAVLHRYGQGGTFWTAHPDLSGSAVTAVELWNEPYFSTGDGNHYDPKTYADMVRAAGIDGHAVDPHAELLLEAEMVSAMTNGKWVWWVDALYKAVPRLNRYFNGIAMHDFGSNVNQLSRIVFGQPYPNFGKVRRIVNLRQQFVAHGGALKPFWIMESGWSTCTQRVVDCTTPARQARNLRTLFEDVRGSWQTWVQAVFVYRYQDGFPSDSVQGGYGLVYTDGQPKPALGIFKVQAGDSAL
jgi:hypothetical protein